MGGPALLLWLGMASAGPCALVAADSIELSEHTIRVGDVVELGCIDPSLRPAVGRLAVATLPDEVERLTMSRPALANLVRRRVPILAHLEAAGAARAMSLQLSGTITRAQPTLASADGAVAAGDELRLVARRGSVHIEREVRALQSGAPGDRLFIRTDDGTVLVAAVPPQSFAAAP